MVLDYKRKSKGSNFFQRNKLKHTTKRTDALNLNYLIIIIMQTLNAIAKPHKKVNYV